MIADLKKKNALVSIMEKGESTSDEERKKEMSHPSEVSEEYISLS